MLYRQWRSELSDLQVAIDEFDEAYDYETYDHDEYTKARQPLIDELNAHYAKEGDAIAASEAQTP